MGYFKYSFPILVLVILVGCADSKPNESLSKVVLVDGAQEVQARIRMHKGHLMIDGRQTLSDAEVLLLAQYHFQVPTKRPKIMYDINEGKGFLLLEQESVPTIGTFPEEGSSIWNQWQLQWNKQTLFDMQIQMNEGQAQLDFADMHLEKLQLDLGSADVYLDLTQAQEAKVIILNMDQSTVVLDVSKDKPVALSLKRSHESIALPGFQKRNDLYYNTAYVEGETYTYIDIRIQNGAKIKVLEK